MSFKLPGLPKKMPGALRQTLFHSLQWDEDDKSGFFSFISSFTARHCEISPYLHFSPETRVTPWCSALAAAFSSSLALNYTLALEEYPMILLR